MYSRVVAGRISQRPKNKKMKSIFFVILGVALSIPFAASVNTNNRCGLGYAPRTRFTHEMKKFYTPPFFVAADMDRDGKPEGRSDSIAMFRHDICVENKGL